MSEVFPIFISGMIGFILGMLTVLGIIRLADSETDYIEE